MEESNRNALVCYNGCREDRYFLCWNVEQIPYHLQGFSLLKIKEKKAAGVYYCLNIPQTQVSFIDGHMELCYFSSVALIFKLRIMSMGFPGNWNSF